MLLWHVKSHLFYNFTRSRIPCPLGLLCHSFLGHTAALKIDSVYCGAVLFLLIAEVAEHICLSKMHTVGSQSKERCSTEAQSSGP